MNHLTLAELSAAVAGKYAAVRRTTVLEALGEKVFPPTYEGGEYAKEPRVVAADDGQTKTVSTVLLDSVQSQANRMEMALLKAVDAGKLRLPLLAVDFSRDTEDPILREVGRVTALETPHRIFDAIFRDSELDGVAFRQTTAGEAMTASKSSNATAIFGYCPTALLFGFWDSTGPRGGLGAKVQRAMVGEIIGYESVEGVRPSSRRDPVEIQNNVEIYAKAGGGFTFDPNEAIRNKSQEPVKIRPSEVNHGNITPSWKGTDGRPNHGGVTLGWAKQNIVLSLAALRRLRFPENGQSSATRDLAAQNVLAALGLVAITLLEDEGFDLRSRCLLDGKPGPFELVGRGESVPFALSEEGAIGLFNEAVTAAKSAGLPWHEDQIVLKPSKDLSRLVSESRLRSMTEKAD